jgi:predicted MFS family arabinose efflux permease
LAGLLIATVGFGWCFLADGLSYFAVLIGLWMIRTEELRPSPVALKAKRQVREGLRYVRSVPELWVPLAMMGLVGTLSYNFQTVFPLFATRDLHGNGTTFTILFSVVSVGALIGALAVARRTTITVRAVAGSALAYGGALALMTVAPNQTVAYIVAPLLGLASIAFLTASTAIVQIESAPEMRGRVLALQAMLFLGSTPIGGPIVGWVSQQFGARYGIAVGAAAAFVAGALGLAYARRASARQAAAVAVGVDDGGQLGRGGAVEDDAVAAEIELAEDRIDALLR